MRRCAFRRRSTVPASPFHNYVINKKKARYKQESQTLDYKALRASTSQPSNGIAECRERTFNLSMLHITLVLYSGLLAKTQSTVFTYARFRFEPLRCLSLEMFKTLKGSLSHYLSSSEKNLSASEYPSNEPKTSLGVWKMILIGLNKIVLHKTEHNTPGNVGEN